MIGVGLTSKTKIEQKAITKIRDIIDSIELFTYHFNEMDKDISWDGNINMYHENIDKKENFDSSIDVQILKRQNKISDDNLIKLVEIKEQSDETEIKLACNILLDNKNEVKALLKTIDSNTLEIFKQYPISIYLH